MRSSASRCAFALVLLLVSLPAASAQTTAEGLFKEAARREAMLRREIDARGAGAPAVPLLQRARTLAQTYEDISRLFPRSSYGDDALWQGATLAASAFWEFGQTEDRVRALELFAALKTRYRASPFVKQIAAQTTRLAAAPAQTPRIVPPAAAARPAARPVPTSVPGPRGPSTLKAIRREVLADTVRVTLELEHEARFDDERIEGPPRVFVDLHDTRVVDALKDASLSFPTDVVRQIRVGRQPDNRTRVVLDLEGAARHSVYALYSPYRLVIDVERRAPAPAPAQPPARTVVAEAAPTPPAANTGGGFSLSRQLGLGVSRIVLDPGHGGHDPGAQVRGLSEATLTLDIALKLERLLVAQPGVEVVLTRRTDAYVPLEERTAIANRASADLFLSIHTNASADARAAGVETYFLNFASNSAAAAVAARENAGSSRTMAELPDIVKTIALHDKSDESRDFAASVQASMYEALRRANRQTRDLGVKQAPFVVLIGATMPSVLAEISFLTNRQEAALLRTEKYRDQIAGALFSGVMTYQKSLKQIATVATQ